MITLRTKPCRKCGRFEFYGHNGKTHACVFCKLQYSQGRYYGAKLKKAIQKLKEFDARNPVVEVEAPEVKVSWIKRIFGGLFTKNKND